VTTALVTATRQGTMVQYTLADHRVIDALEDVPFVNGL
jgi:hypothetical protein